MKNEPHALIHKQQGLRAQHKHQYGLSLVQLLVGLAVGAFVILISTQMYFVIREKYQGTVNSMQENTTGLTVSYVIRNAVDHAGFSLTFGTWPWQRKTLRIPGATFNPLVYPPIYAAGSINGFTPNAQVPGTDLLLIQHMINTEITTQLISKNNEATTIPTTFDVMPNDFLLLANQQHAELMKTTNNPNTVAQGPSIDFKSGSILGHYRTTIFYLRQNDDNRSLFINIDGAARGEEIVNNIDNFEIEYYAGTTWQRVLQSGNTNYINAWHKEVKGIRLNYTVNNRAYQITIAIKANSNCS